MANWYSTYFETKDKDIVKLIKDGQTIDFNYNEENGNGNCSLRWGLNALDMDAIDNIATNNNSSFFIRATDVMGCSQHIWGYENGKENVAEVKEIEPVWQYVDDVEE